MNINKLPLFFRLLIAYLSLLAIIIAALVILNATGLGSSYSIKQERINLQPSINYSSEFSESDRLKQQPRLSQPALSPTPLPTWSPSFDWQLPPIPTGETWQKETIGRQKAKQGFCINFENHGSADNIKANNEELYEICGPGTYYYTQVPNSELKTYEDVKAFLNQYFELEKQGWHQQLNWGEYWFGGAALYSPCTSVNGVIKLNGYQIRTVVFTDQLNCSGEVKSQYSDILYKKVGLFISDPIDLRQYLEI